MDKDLLLATTNQGKIREMQAFLAEFPLRILSLQALEPIETFPETGKTFCANAQGKSLYYSRHWEGLTLGEDSGLEIDYLGGAPGVISARFAGPGTTDDKNIAKVLHLMLKAAPSQRRARFVSCMALSQKGKLITEITGRVEGFIAREKKGRHGFGYDPIFFYPPLEKNFAELLPEEKNEVSHRGCALLELKNYLQKTFF